MKSSGGGNLIGGGVCDFMLDGDPDGRLPGKSHLNRIFHHTQLLHVLRDALQPPCLQDTRVER